MSKLEIGFKDIIFFEALVKIFDLKKRLNLIEENNENIRLSDKFFKKAYIAAYSFHRDRPRAWKLKALFEHFKVEHWTKVSADLNQATYDYVEYKVSLFIFYNIKYI